MQKFRDISEERQVSMASDKLTQLREKRKALNEQIRREENRRNRQARKNDTRRKILVGAAILHKASSDKQYETWLVNTLLNGFLTRPDDRALFGLAPLPEKDGSGKKGE